MAEDIKKIAQEFFEACETGKGWEVCSAYCTDGATFAAQTDVLAEVKTLEGYTDWMKGLLTILPDGHYELKTFAVDPEHSSVCAFTVFHGNHTGDGGPVPPTGKTITADYVYDMKFDGGKISHMTRILNDAQSVRGLGWA